MKFIYCLFSFVIVFTATVSSHTDNTFGLHANVGYGNVLVIGGYNKACIIWGGGISRGFSDRFELILKVDRFKIDSEYVYVHKVKDEFSYTHIGFESKIFIQGHPRTLRPFVQIGAGGAIVRKTSLRNDTQTENRITLAGFYAQIGAGCEFNTEGHFSPFIKSWYTYNDDDDRYLYNSFAFLGGIAYRFAGPPRKETVKYDGQITTIFDNMKCDFGLGIEFSSRDKWNESEFCASLGIYKYFYERWAGGAKIEFHPTKLGSGEENTAYYLNQWDEPLMKQLSFINEIYVTPRKNKLNCNLAFGPGIAWLEKFTIKTVYNGYYATFHPEYKRVVALALNIAPSISYGISNHIRLYMQFSYSMAFDEEDTIKSFAQLFGISYDIKN